MIKCSTNFVRGWRVHQSLNACQHVGTNDLFEHDKLLSDRPGRGL